MLSRLRYTMMGDTKKVAGSVCFQEVCIVRQWWTNITDFYYARTYARITVNYQRKYEENERNDERKSSDFRHFGADFWLSWRKIPWN